jgi:hypothetical protein
MLTINNQIYMLKHPNPIFFTFTRDASMIKRKNGKQLPKLETVLMTKQSIGYRKNLT